MKNLKVWMIAGIALVVGTAGGITLAEQRRINPQPWELFEPEAHRPGDAEPPVGRYQAVSDGEGGLLIIDTRNTYIIKHVIKEKGGWAVKYDALELRVHE